MPTSQSLVVTDVNYDTRTVTFATDHNFSPIRENLVPVTEYYTRDYVNYGITWWEPAMTHSGTAITVNTIQRSVDQVTANPWTTGQRFVLPRVNGVFKPKNYHGEMEGSNF
jgi:hypothetical protein